MSMNTVEQINIFEDYKISIAGELLRKDKSFVVINPATEEVVAQAPEGTVEDVDAAVIAANAAFKDWSQKSYAERGQYLKQFAELLELHKEDLKKLLTLEHGKPLHSGANTELEMTVTWCKELSEKSLNEKL